MASSLNFFIYCLFSTVILAVASNKNTHGSEETAQQYADRVMNLPGQPAVKFRHYSGYVKVGPNDEKALFYWFFEAQEATSLKPLVLWLNGGPGCSSIANGAAQELGPFLVGSNGTQLTLNKFSWNKVANMLFLEAPVGVGFSYATNSRDFHNLGDQVTANDSHAFLMRWFKRFPRFKSHDFYIAGESYAGHYAPQLAEVINEKNKGVSKNSYINLKGFMIGNAVLNAEADFNGLIDYAWSHAIISDQLYKTMKRECDFRRGGIKSLMCTQQFPSFYSAYVNINMYSIYSPICPNNTIIIPSKHSVSPHHHLAQHDPWNKLAIGHDPCTKDYVERYFNREDVQRAMHANVTNLSYPYTTCSNVIGGWNDSPDNVLPIIKKLLNARLRVWIYSGDTDGRVPVTSTRYSINKMNIKVKEKWRAWFDKSEVAGWVETYEGGLTLATVRGAGHQVPLFAPEQSLYLFTNFLTGNTLPSFPF